jgi:hypothetical protein
MNTMLKTTTVYIKLQLYLQVNLSFMLGKVMLHS